MRSSGSRAAAMIGLLTLLLVACSSPDSHLAGGNPEAGNTQGAPNRQPKTLHLVTRLEAPDLVPKSSESGGGNEPAKRLFNAALAVIDATVVAHPYLAGELPQLNTPSWQVFPDGRMEMT